MPDERERQLQRAAAAGDLQAAGRLLLEQVRTGALRRRRLEALAAARDPAAAVALGEPLPRLRPGEGADLTRFRRRLAEAVVLCSERRPRDRSPAALLEAIADPALEPDETLAHALPLPRRLAQVKAVCEARGRLLEASGALPDPRAHGLAGGRLLLVDPDTSLGDGIAGAITDGLLDAADAPPPALWLHYAVDGLPPGSWRSFRSCLVAWIPPAWLERCDAAVEGNGHDCLTWADRHTGAFARALKAAGLTPAAP